MLDFVIENTRKFISSVPKSKRKAYGQFFTSKASAKFMAEMFDIDLCLPEIRLLDAGCGTGILTAAWIDMARARGYRGKIYVTCYETDPKVIPVLTENLEYIKANGYVEYVIKAENYIINEIY